MSAPWTACTVDTVKTFTLPCKIWLLLVDICKGPQNRGNSARTLCLWGASTLKYKPLP